MQSLNALSTQDREDELRRQQPVAKNPMTQTLRPPLPLRHHTHAPQETPLMRLTKHHSCSTYAPPIHVSMLGVRTGPRGRAAAAAGGGGGQGDDFNNTCCSHCNTSAGSATTVALSHDTQKNHSPRTRISLPKCLEFHCHRTERTS